MRIQRRIFLAAAVVGAGLCLLASEGARGAREAGKTPTTSAGGVKPPSTTTAPATTQAGEILDVRQALILARTAPLAPGLVALDAVTYGDTPAGKAYVAAQSCWCRGQRDLASAVAARFGKSVLPGLRLEFPPLNEAERQAAREFGEMHDPAIPLIQNARISKKGDAATIELGPAPALHARRFGDGWKVRFEDFSGGVETIGEAPGLRPEPKSTLESYQRLARVDIELAQDVAAGRFKSTDQLNRTRQLRQRRALKELVPQESPGPSTHPVGEGA